MCHRLTRETNPHWRMFNLLISFWSLLSRKHMEKYHLINWFHVCVVLFPCLLSSDPVNHHLHKQITVLFQCLSICRQSLVSVYFVNHGSSLVEKLFTAGKRDFSCKWIVFMHLYEIVFFMGRTSVRICSVSTHSIVEFFSSIEQMISMFITEKKLCLHQKGSDKSNFNKEETVWMKWNDLNV